MRNMSIDTGRFLAWNRNTLPDLGKKSKSDGIVYVTPSTSEGYKGIAGSLVFVILDRAALYGLMQRAKYAQKDYGNDPYLQNAFLGQEDTGDRMAAVGEIGDVGMNAATPVYPDQLLQLGGSATEVADENLVNCWDPLRAPLPQRSSKEQTRWLEKCGNWAISSQAPKVYGTMGKVQRLGRNPWGK